MSEERKPTTPQAAEAEERGDPQVARSPDYKAHYGRVQAAVWRRDIDGRTGYSVSLTRSYKDKSDQWQRTTNLDEEDAPIGLRLHPAGNQIAVRFVGMAMTRSWTRNFRIAVSLAAAGLALGVAAAPAGACGGLVAPNGAVLRIRPPHGTETPR